MNSETWLARAWSTGRYLMRGLVQLVYPNTCWLCAQPLAEELRGFCIPCRTLLTADRGARCPRCAATVGAYVELERGCIRCRDESFAFDRVVCLGGYEGLLRDVVLRLKHANAEGLAERLGELWAEASADKLRALAADAIVPIPLHWWRHLRRGYNQSQALARSLARALHVPCRPRWLRRVRATADQRGQSPTLRRENVRGAFRAPAGLLLEGKTILLVDDVLTTGSTAHEAARALRAARPARIVVAILARASPG